MPAEETSLEQALAEIERLRMYRQREMVHHRYIPWKRFTQQELNDEVCPTYKNLLVGRSRRIPDRQMMLNIADYLECSSSERNDLLLAAGYLPVQTALSPAKLEQALEQAQHTMMALPYPAMIVTHTEDIRGYNEYCHQLFQFPQLAADGRWMNRVDLHFSPDLPVRTRSTFDQASLEQWEAHAVRGIRAFKQNHMLSRHDGWYQDVVKRFGQYDVAHGHLEEAAAREEDSLELTQTILAKSEAAGDWTPIQFKQFSISTGGLMYPQIQVFLPVDKAAHQVFEGLGCSVDCGLAEGL